MRAFLVLLPVLALSASAINIRTVVPAPSPTTTAPKTTTPNAAPPAAVPNRAAPAPVRPGAALYPRQWNLDDIRMPEAWAVARSAPVTVAVLDTGYAPLADLPGRVVNGYDFVSDESVSGDGDGRDPDATDTGATAYHASMIASIVGGRHDGAGAAGVNPAARIVQIRVADDHGQVRVDDLVDGLRWSAGLSVPGVPANPHPARVVNLSLFADFIPLDRCDARVQAALTEVRARGVTVVAGAGNDARDARGLSPAGCRDVITVTATAPSGARAPYANWGAAVTLAAPGGTGGGGEITTVTPAGAVRRTGTSLAAPHVTGVVSLMLGLKPTLTPAQITEVLVRTAAAFPNGRCDVQLPTRTCGRGRLDAAAALSALTTPVGRR